MVVPTNSASSPYQPLALIDRDGPPSRLGRGAMPRPEEMGLMMFDPREEQGVMMGFGKMDMHPMVDPFEMINDVLAEFTNMIGGGMMMPMGAGGIRGGRGGPMGFGMIMGGFMDPEAMQMMMMNGDGGMFTCFSRIFSFFLFMKKKVMFLNIMKYLYICIYLNGKVGLIDRAGFLFLWIYF